MRRAIFNTIALILAFVLQTSVFPLFPYLDNLPNLLLVVLLSIAFPYGDREGMLYGMLAGLMMDLFYSDAFGYYMLLYMGLGFAFGLFASYYEEEYIILPLAMCAAGDAVFNLYIFLMSFLRRGRTDVLFYLGRIIIPEIILTVSAFLLLYRPLQMANHYLYDLDHKRRG